MTAPVIRQYIGTIPDKGQAQIAFDTNIDSYLDWQTLQFAPDLVAFGAWADQVRAALIAGNLPTLTGRQLDAVRVNAAGNGVEFADVTAAGWALLDDANAAAQRVTLGAAPLAGPTFTGTATAPMARLTSATDVDLTSTGHAFQIGPSNGANLRMDANEIMALNDGVGVFLGLNIEGGEVAIGKLGGSQDIELFGQVVINGSDFVASGTAPLYACRAWVNFNGTGTVAIRASGNVSSITDNGVGDYTINFATAMQDANYAAVGTMMSGDGSSGVRFFGIGLKTTTSVKMYCSNDSRGGNDSQFSDLAIFR